MSFHDCSYLITNYQLPITNYHLPFTNYQLPITNYKAKVRIWISLSDHRYLVISAFRIITSLFTCRYTVFYQALGYD
jgi:hypothetical protein